MALSMARILFTVLTAVRRPLILRSTRRLIPRLIPGRPLAGLLCGLLVAACAGDDGPRPMHIATTVEGQAVKVEVTDIPAGREITDLVLVDSAGRETPARDRELITREEGYGGNAGPGIGLGASGGSSSGIRPFISLGYIFGGGSQELRRSQHMTAEIPLDDPQRYAAGWRDWRVVLRYRDELGELQQVSVPAPVP